MLVYLKKLTKLLRNKYIAATLLFVVWIAFFDQTNLIYDMHLTQKERQMKAQKLYYQKQTQVVTEQLKELQADPASLEKFAREKYFMKKANEDVYILVDRDNHLLDTLNVKIQ